MIIGAIFGYIFLGSMVISASILMIGMAMWVVVRIIKDLKK